MTHHKLDLVTPLWWECFPWEACYHGDKGMPFAPWPLPFATLDGACAVSTAIADPPPPLPVQGVRRDENGWSCGTAFPCVWMCVNVCECRGPCACMSTQDCKCTQSKKRRKMQIFDQLTAALICEPASQQQRNTSFVEWDSHFLCTQMLFSWASHLDSVSRLAWHSEGYFSANQKKHEHLLSFKIWTSTPYSAWCLKYQKT